MQVAVVILGLLVLPGCGCGVPEKREVALPPRDASPEQVLRTYFDAIVGQDANTFRAVLTSDADFGHELDASDGPFHAWFSASDLRIEGPYEDGDCRRGATCVAMVTTFVLSRCLLDEWPGGLQSTSFGLRLVDGRWLVYGHGDG
ncbi:hypothetical protein JOL79_08780 [Microbispora sp. RL4-1S]|uniref:Uncharacterized protein n=1 Tax=Microbispora oryzae TaxID=2806554 RepID=A0A941AHB2_9ACTN|nr:hypothetical protein [Microbispora oryzae]MBP2703900.1 hypothetical protein [Microbispora oryzae]